MRTLLILPLIFALLSAISPRARAESNVLGFQAWKASRIDEAKTALEKLTTEGGMDRPMPSGTPGNAARIDKRVEPAKPAQAHRNDPKLQQAELNVEVAQELTVNDYFVLYLNQFKDKEALLEAAKKLSPEEVAELMMAYRKNLNGAEQAETQAPGLLGGVGSLASPRPAAAGM